MIVQEQSGDSKAELNERLTAGAWGALLVATGAIWMMPGERVPPGTWLLTIGFILAALNVLRYANGIRVRGFSVVAAMVALAAGLGALLGLSLPLVGIALIGTGGYLLLRAVADRRSACTAS